MRISGNWSRRLRFSDQYGGSGSHLVKMAEADVETSMAVIYEAADNKKTDAGSE